MGYASKCPPQALQLTIHCTRGYLYVANSPHTLRRGPQEVLCKRRFEDRRIAVRSGRGQRQRTDDAAVHDNRQRGQMHVIPVALNADGHFSQPRPPSTPPTPSQPQIRPFSATCPVSWALKCIQAADKPAATTTVGGHAESVMIKMQNDEAARYREKTVDRHERCLPCCSVRDETASYLGWAWGGGGREKLRTCTESRRGVYSHKHDIGIVGSERFPTASHPHSCPT